MKLIIAMVILPIALIVGFLILVDIQADKEVRVINAQSNLERTRATNEAMLMREASQANQANAIALNMVTMALVPWGVLFSVSLLGLGVLTLVFTMIYFRHSEVKQLPPPIIVYLPSPEAPRRQVWDGIIEMSNNRQMEIDVVHRQK